MSNERLKQFAQRSAVPVVYLLDDDLFVRETLAKLLREAGYRTQLFSEGDDLLSATPEAPGCVVLDLQLPGQDGIAIQQQLKEKNWRLPIIFISGAGSIPKAAQAMKAGALDFLTKPINREVFLELITSAVELSRKAFLADLQKELAIQRISLLTKRELEVLQWVIAGLLNKEIADVLGTTLRTVKAHRGKIIEKLHAESIVDIIRCAQLAEVAPGKLPVDDLASLI